MSGLMEAQLPGRLIRSSNRQKVLDLGDALEEFRKKYPNINFTGHICYSVDTVIWKDGKIEPTGGIFEDIDVYPD